MIKDMNWYFVKHSTIYISVEEKVKKYEIKCIKIKIHSKYFLMDRPWDFSLIFFRNLAHNLARILDNLAHTFSLFSPHFSAI